MYTFAEENDLKSFDTFVVNNKGTFLQSSRWIKVKKAWEPRFYSGFCDGKRVLTCLILIRKLPVVGSIWYISCGPVCDYSNKELQKEFSNFIRTQMKFEGATCSIIDPLIPLRINGEDCEQGLEVHNILNECGYSLNPKIETYTYKHPVQLYLNLKDEQGNAIPSDKILKGCEKGVRYSVRIGKQRGLVSKTYTYEDIKNNPLVMKDFESVMNDTSDRNNFVARQSDYCSDIIEIFKDETDVTLVYYDRELDEKLEQERQQKKKELQKKLQTAPEKKIKGIKNDIEAIDNNTKSYMQRVNETNNYPENAKIPVAGGLTLRYAGVASCLFGGTRNIVRNNTRSSHYLNYLRICRSIDAGCDIHDLGYVLVKTPKLTPQGTLGNLEPTDNFVGINDFKKSFGSDYIEFIGEYVLVGNRFKYFLYDVLMPKIKKVRIKFVKIMKKIKG